MKGEQEIEKKVVTLTFHKVPGTNQSSTPPKVTMGTNGLIRATKRAWEGGVGRNVGEPRAVTLADLRPT